MQHMNGLLDDSIHTLRKIAGQWIPALLDLLGLMAAMEWQAKEWEDRTGITCRIQKQSEEPHVSNEQATQLFRIFQELLTNVGRHAHATSVEVIMGHAGDKLYLEVSDNGQGIHEEEIHRPMSLGIVGREERAARIGGRMQFTGHPGAGTAGETSRHYGARAARCGRQSQSWPVVFGLCDRALEGRTSADDQAPDGQGL